VLPLALIAEHGVWLRPPGGQWALQHQINAEWKNGVRPLLQHHLDRLPGALLEEKEFSIAWHYRRADVGQAAMRAKELLDDLSDYTRNIDIQVLEGDKVLEVRRTSVTKGTAGQQWLQTFKADFIMAIGDDWTDEDLFLALPKTAWTVRVGLAATSARYFLPSHEAVRGLLRAFTTIYNPESSAILTRFSLSTALPATTD
jgi:trehalose 6-phosphate synthase/phosphatase